MMKTKGLLTDFYELTMMQGYYLQKYNPPAVFEMFYRRQPFHGGYAVFAGLSSLLTAVQDLCFSPEDRGFLEKTGIFRNDFLRYLQSLRFTGDIYAMNEGEIVFPNEPLIQIRAPLIEAQWIESLLLNIINFQSLIATKTSRIVSSARGKDVLEFGLRRAHGPDGAVSGARAAFIGGAAATSNTLAGKLFSIPVKGTMAHSWIMAFEDEKSAFEKYAEIYPRGCVLLIDTYDTLDSGIGHAVEVGRNLKNRGILSFGVRLDSGNLSELSKKVRASLDKAGLEHAKIVVSNDLDEYSVEQLMKDDAPIDILGVGTNLITARDDPALGGVYKLISLQTAAGIRHMIKISNEPEKHLLPGEKQVYREVSGEGSPIHDVIALEQEQETWQTAPIYKLQGSEQDSRREKRSAIQPLLSCKMKNGKIKEPVPSLTAVQQKVKKGLAAMPGKFTRIHDPESYPVFLSKGLFDLRNSLNHNNS